MRAVLILFRAFEEIHDFPELELGFLATGHIVKSDASVAVGNKPGAAFTDG